MKQGIKGNIRNYVSFENFVSLFIVFKGFPFYELWTNEELANRYDYFVKNGYMFGYYTEEGKCVSMITIYPYVKGEHPVSFEDGQKVMYLSDVATLINYRHRGFGTKLFEHAIEFSKNLGYDKMYLRTTNDDSMSAGIAKRCGFTQIWDLCQEVEFMRTDGKVKKDLRIFLEKKL